jgi:hypothetical protein
MRGAILIDINSWNSSLQAYGKHTCDICKEKNENSTS